MYFIFLAINNILLLYSDICRDYFISPCCCVTFVRDSTLSVTADQLDKPHAFYIFLISCLFRLMTLNVSRHNVVRTLFLTIDNILLFTVFYQVYTETSA